MNKMILFGITALLEVGFLVWTRADYRSTLLDGVEYEVPAAIEFHGGFYERNYLPIQIPIHEAKWQEDKEPAAGETIYLVPAKTEKGLLAVDHAQLEEPSGDYIRTRAIYVMDGTVYFDFPADRMYMNPDQLKKLSIIELSERVQIKDQESGKTETRMKNELTALIRIKDGRVAVSRVLANGGPIEQTFTTIGKNLSVKYATSGAEKDQYNEKRAFSAGDAAKAGKDGDNRDTAENKGQ